MAQLLDLNTWDRVSPVLLPLDPPTMVTVFTASLGVLMPFAIFVVALFSYLHTLWLLNASGDSDDNSYSALGQINKSTSGGKGELYDNGDEPSFLAVSVGGRQASAGSSSFIDQSSKKNFFSESRPGVALRLSSIGSY